MKGLLFPLSLLDVSLRPFIFILLDRLWA